MNTVISAPPIKINRQIDASVEETWQAWTDAELMSRWFAPGTMRAEVLALDVREGGAYRIRMHGSDGATHTVTGTFTAVVPHKKLAMTWSWEDTEDGVTSNVTVQFAASGDGTELQILHEGLPDQDSVEKHTQGWEGCLANLTERIKDF